MTGRGTGVVRFNLRTFASSDPAMRLLLLFGTAERGDAAGRFEHELGYLADPGFDEQTFLEVCESLMDSASVALIDLGSAAARLTFRAAREGALVYEREPGLFLGFRLRAIHNWCDLEPVIQAAHDRAHAPS